VAKSGRLTGVKTPILDSLAVPDTAEILFAFSSPPAPKIEAKNTP